MRGRRLRLQSHVKKEPARNHQGLGNDLIDAAEHIPSAPLVIAKGRRASRLLISCGIDRELRVQSRGNFRTLRGPHSHPTLTALLRSGLPGSSQSSLDSGGQPP